MKKQKNNLLRIRKILLILAPFCLFLSYYPVILLGANPTMNFELSISLIWLLVFSIISVYPDIIFIINILKKQRSPKENTLLISSFIFLFYSLLSILWSPNFPRALLATGVLWCIFISVISIIEIFRGIVDNDEKKAFSKRIVKSIFIATGIFCLLCWTQCVLDVIGIGREYTLMCLGCTYRSFGFPHPSGMAIEPQFMGNLLLAPAIIAFYLILKRRRDYKLYILSIMIFTTLFLTLSRGAIFAFAFGIFALVVYEFCNLLKEKKILNILSSIFVVLISFVLCVFAQGIFSSLSPTNDTFLSGISKSVNQLSLGVIKIDYDSDQKIEETPEDIEKAKGDEPASNIVAEESTFSGYVEESTNTRLNLAYYAIMSWANNPATFVFGSGIGSAGIIMHKNFPSEIWEKEIVQNEFIEILLEQGIIGASFTILVLIILIKKAIRKNKSVFLATLGAFCLSYCFFSGFTNAVHIFIFTVVIFFCINNNKNPEKSNKKGIKSFPQAVENFNSPQVF